MDNPCCIAARETQCEEWKNRAVEAIDELDNRLEELEKRLIPVSRSEGCKAEGPTTPQLDLVPVAASFRELWRKADSLNCHAARIIDLLEV